MNSYLLDRRLSVAPMMDWTDRHYRYMQRLLAPRTLLYTEMVTAAALAYGDVDRHLAFDPQEHPLALQLGGSEPALLARGAALAREYGYDEINLNCGCPSDRVQSGRFGACLMAEPQLVAECVAAMREAGGGLPVTVKTRIGIDDLDSYEHLQRFVATVAEAGCETFIVHARKAWLQGLSPKENREIPPLDYPRVHRLKADFPQLEIVINGGIRSLEEIQAQLRHVDGVMVGREAYANPVAVGQWEAALWPQPVAALDGVGAVRAMLPYIERQLSRGVRLASITRHLLGLFHGIPGARAWRRHLSVHAPRPGAGVEVVEAALRFVAEPAAALAEGG